MKSVKIIHMRKLVILLLLIPWASAWAGGLYYYVDDKGVYHFSDTRNDEHFNKMIVWTDRGGGGAKVDLQINFDQYIRQACSYYAVDENLIRAMIKIESNYDPNAVSRKGAQGLMQLMPGTAQMMRLIDPYHPRDNIYAGVAYFRTLLDRYQGNEKFALAAYNAGPGAVDKYQGVPPYQETRNYVQRVQLYREKYGERNGASNRYKSRVIILSEKTITKK